MSTSTIYIIVGWALGALPALFELPVKEIKEICIRLDNAILKLAQVAVWEEVAKLRNSLHKTVLIIVLGLNIILLVFIACVAIYGSVPFLQLRLEILDRVIIMFASFIHAVMIYIKVVEPIIKARKLIRKAEAKFGSIPSSGVNHG